jgi:hypothetical protein
MMKTVFVSGSRKISRLNQETRERLENIIKRGLEVVIGDANGSDKAVQSFFAERKYPHVTIYCTGNTCRNNVGAWKIHAVEANKNLSGRAFYTLKDKEMARNADVGMVLWDGKSTGSLNNILEMASQNKLVVVYFFPTREFIDVKTLEDAKVLLSKCEAKDLAEITKKSSLTSSLGKGEYGQQMLFGI